MTLNFQVNISNPNTLEAAITHARLVECQLELQTSAEASKDKTAHINYLNYEPRDQAGQIQHEKDRISELETRMARAELAYRQQLPNKQAPTQNPMYSCFRCGQQGHYARTCPTLTHTQNGYMPNYNQQPTNQNPNYRPSYQDRNQSPQGPRGYSAYRSQPYNQQERGGNRYPQPQNNNRFEFNRNNNTQNTHPQSRYPPPTNTLGHTQNRRVTFAPTLPTSKEFKS